MRDKARIKPMLKLIKQIWEANPDLRLMQLLGNCLNTLMPLNEYNCEDNELIVMLRRVYQFPNTDTYTPPKETPMNIEQKVTSLELSKQLKEAGFPQGESEFAWMTFYNKSSTTPKELFSEVVPCNDIEEYEDRNFLDIQDICDAPLPCELGEVFKKHDIVHSCGFDDEVGNAWIRTEDGKVYCASKLADAMSYKYLYLIEKGLIK